MNAVSTAIKAVPTSTTMPILGCVLLEVNNGTVTVTGTDLNTVIISKYEQGSLIGKQFKAVIPAKQFFELLKKYTDDYANLTLSELTLHIKCGKSTCELSVYDPTEYPAPPVIDGVEATIFGSEAHNLLGQVVYAVSEDHSRPFLTGLHLEGKAGKLCACATDSWRLGYNETESSAEFGGVLIPGSAIKSVLATCPATLTDLAIRVGEKRVAFTFGDTTIITSLIEGSFPNFRALLPTANTNYVGTAKLNRKDTLNATERVKLMCESKQAKMAHVTFNDKGCTIASKRNERGQGVEEIDALVEGDIPSVVVDVDYLNDVLKAIPDEEVILNFTGPTKPVYLQGDSDSNARHLLMPIKVPGV